VGCRALPEFGRSKLSTQKVGNEIVMGGEGGPKKVEPNFCLFEAELFFRISRHHRSHQIIADGILHKKKQGVEHTRISRTQKTWIFI
jgi:hypothetical protein